MTTPSPRSLLEVLELISQTQESTRDVGTRFEEVVLVYLNNDSTMQATIDEAWTYLDWVDKFELEKSRQETGIDIVARKRPEHGGGWVAVQAKYRERETVLKKSDIDSFVTDAQVRGIDDLMFVDSTSVPPSKHFLEVINKLKIRHKKFDDLDQSDIDWDQFIHEEELVLRPSKTPRPHQKEAVLRVQEGLLKGDRGQIILACGTGKTYTGLLIAEQQFGLGSRILVLVPSLALMSQMIREWHSDKSIPFRSFSVCSDVDVAKSKRKDDDRILIRSTELDIPPTTDPKTLAGTAAQEDDEAMTVIFATYHSIDVIHRAQHEFGLPDFNLILCDEAHRTTGQIDADKDASVFVRVHDAEYVRSKKRLYMTATPKIYSATSKTKAQEGAIELCSMDNVEQFGEVLYYKSFAWAVENELLSDYKVLVFALDEGAINAAIQHYLESEDCDIPLDDATKIVGCCKALMKETHPDRVEDFASDPDPSIRALAFCNTIKNSKAIQKSYSEVFEKFTEISTNDERKYPRFEVQHVDGTMGSHLRTTNLKWLGDDLDVGEVRILSNVRCLGEGVDVPALDAIIFFHSRKSQVDVVQAVGRVMRKAPGKKFGYVILPVAIPAGMTPEESLKNNKTYKTVWKILNALRSHDERLEAEINRLHLEGESLDRVKLLMGMSESAETEINKQSTPSTERTKTTEGIDEAESEELPAEKEHDIWSKQVNAFGRAMYAQIVKRVGRASYWSDWAGDVGRIAQTQITRIGTILQTDENAQEVFGKYLKELQQDLNPAVSVEQAIELLSQHVITRPIFDALFSGHAFVTENSVSKAMDKVVSLLDTKNIDKETESLEGFYEDVRWRIKDTKTSQAKQSLIKELYDKFFRKAFPKTTEMLGIAFTPVELVDYVIHSTEHLMNKHFDMSLSDEGVHIIDPFVGTGTFITRLLQSGIIRSEDLTRKYKEEIHANELVLLAYYVAGINIEAVYHEERDKNAGHYEPFNNLVFQDTFQSTKQVSLEYALFPRNHQRIDRQSQLPLTVILGNPPYSKGQKVGDDDAQNVKYVDLDERIQESYAQSSSAKLRISLYDSYIRAFRWASDRLHEKGIIGFVSGAGWLDGNAASGIRARFAEEFSHIYVVNLRGDARQKGEAWRKEGERYLGKLVDQRLR